MTGRRLLLRKEEKSQIPDLKFHKTFTMGEIHASMPNPVESIGYINSYSSSIPRPTKGICNFETVKATARVYLDLLKTFAILKL